MHAILYEQSFFLCWRKEGRRVLPRTHPAVRGTREEDADDNEAQEEPDRLTGEEFAPRQGNGALGFPDEDERGPVIGMGEIRITGVEQGELPQYC